MDPELNDDLAPRDLTDAEQATVDAAFNAGFDNPTHGHDLPATAAESTQAAAPAPAEPAVAIEDPYKDLPEPVRQAIAKVNNLEIQLRTANGRIAALQSDKDKSRSQPAASPAPAPAEPARPNFDKVRQELPEVADAIEEMLNQRNATQAPAPAPANAAATADANEAKLNETMAAVYPDWDKKMVSPEFGLWLGQQPRDVQDTIATTSDIGVAVKHLRQFDAYQDRVQQATTQSVDATKQRRLAAAAQPSGARRAPVDTNLTDEDAFNAGFAAVRSGTG